MSKMSKSKEDGKKMRQKAREANAKEFVRYVRTISDNRFQELVDGNKRWAMANKSDPFAYSRAMSHLKNGIASYRPDGEDAFYNAKHSLEERTLVVNGVESTYMVSVYTDLTRP